jgi:hypothetical protein
MDKKDVQVVSDSRKNALTDIGDRFGVKDTVKHLQKLMSDVTKEEITPDTVNAACNCVQNLNLTIKTAIQAAKFLSDK